MLAHVLPLYRLLAVRPDTQVVIEGFPRCANSFAVVAFLMSQRTPVGVAHHLHSVAQVRRGVQRRLPTLVLLRGPHEAVLSLTIRKQLPNIGWALDEYVDFYAHVARMKEDVVFADFEQVTGDFGDVIRRLNERFKTSFTPFDHTEENVAECYRQVEEIEMDAGNVATPRWTHVARPTPERTAMKQELSRQFGTEPYDRVLAHANEIYESLREHTR